MLLPLSSSPTWLLLVGLTHLGQLQVLQQQRRQRYKCPAFWCRGSRVATIRLALLAAAAAGRTPRLAARLEWMMR